MSKPLLGCIADDFTGATDLASNLVRAGMRVVQTIGVPSHTDTLEADAVVVALKSRTVPAADAVAMSLQALRWLQGLGAERFYFKYCSTFDSTPHGNIGPVTDALMDALGTALTVATPAFPENGRTLYQGHLFVGDVLLSDSGMRDHPLTPMRDSNLVRVLQAQTQRRVGLVAHPTVAQGVQAIRTRLGELAASGVGMVVVDALNNGDLVQLAAAVRDLPLVTAGSGLALGMPAAWGLQPTDQAARLPPATGRRAVVSGSCSVATNAQVADFLGRGGASWAVDPLDLADGVPVVEQALSWARQQDPTHTVLVYATAAPARVQAVQARLGVERAGALVESALAQVARGLVEQGVGQLVVAGGETSGACVQALGIDRLRIGAPIAPGVPWCHADVPVCGGAGLHITLKSGNFGQAAFFTQAFGLLA